MSKHLLALSAVKFTADQIGELKRRCPNYRYLLEDVFPEFCINKEFGNIMEGIPYLQFTDEGDEEFILFDLDTIDPFLKEEINGGGLFGEFSMFNKKDEKIIVDIIKNHATIYKPDDILNSPEYIIVNINYFGGFPPDYDYDVEYSIDGFMNKNLEIIKIKNNEQSK